MKRGLTLLELLVAAGLGLVVLSLTATLLYATSTSSARVQTRIDIQQQAVRASAALVSDLMQCTPRSLGVLYAPDCDCVISLHKVVDVTNVAPAEQIFDRRLTVYYSSGGGLYRRFLPDGQPPTLGELGLDPLPQSQPTRAGSQGNLLKMVSSGPAGRTRLCDSMRAFQISWGSQPASPQSYQSAASPPSVVNPLTFSLLLEKEVKGGIARNGRGNPCETFRIQRTVWLRDGE